jgi:hypothetical protein
MMSEHAGLRPPEALRATVAADLGAIRPLRSPWLRAAALIPFAALLLVAAPTIFDLRDTRSLGWLGTWGASSLQALVGLALAAAALHDAVPGRGWRPRALALLMTLPLALVVVVTVASWRLDPATPRSALAVGAICLVATLLTALPATVLTAVLAMRAYPTRPTTTGLLAGLGGGLMADSGWRLFCHFSEPSHVFAAHTAGVFLSALVGMWLVWRWR